MKAVIKLILLLGFFGLLLLAHHVYLYQKVLIEFGGYKVEPSLSVVLVAFILLMLVVYLLIRAVLFLIFLPHHFRQWRKKKRGEKQDRHLEESLRALALGDEEIAERKLSQLAEACEAAPEAFLLAAFSAQRQGLAQRYANLLGKASGNDGNSNSPVKRVARGCLAMAGERHAEALNEFRAVESSMPKARKLLELIAECNLRLGDSNAALMNWMAIAKLKSPPDEAATANVVAQLDKVTDHALIAELHKEEQSKLAKESPEFAACLARRLAFAGMESETNALLKAQVKGGPSDEILEAVADVGPEQLVDAAIDSAEANLAKGEKSAPLLRALGRLYMRKSLWKKAREKMEASLSISPDPRTHAVFAALLKETEAPDDEVIAQYKQASGAGRAALARTS